MKTKSLDEFVDQTAFKIFGRTKAHAHHMGVCIDCNKPPTFKTEAGRREYEISGLCEPCFDAIFDESIWED